MKMGKGRRVKKGRGLVSGFGFQMVERPTGCLVGSPVLEKILCAECKEEKLVEKWEVEWMDQNIKRRLCVPCQMHSGLILGGEVFQT